MKILLVAISFIIGGCFGFFIYSLCKISSMCENEDIKKDNDFIYKERGNI